MTPEEYCIDKAAPAGSTLHYALLFVPPPQQRALVLANPEGATGQLAKAAFPGPTELTRKIGDYQANLAMPLGKRLGRPPREVAAEVVRRLDLSGLCHPAEIAGPGFINLTLHPERLAAEIAARVGDARLGVPEAPEVAAARAAGQPAAPVIVTRTGGLLFCFMVDLCPRRKKVLAVSVRS